MPALPATPTTSFLSCSMSPESPWHLKFLSASNWLHTLCGHSQVSQAGVPFFHLSTASHLCWQSYLRDCLEMFIVAGWRPGPHTAGPVPVLLAWLTPETISSLPGAAHTCQLQQHMGPMGSEKPVCHVFWLSVWKMSWKGIESGWVGSLA